MPHLWIELWLMRMIGALAGSWELLDRVMYLLVRNDLLKGVPFAAALLGLWAVSQLAHREAERVSVLHIVLAAMASLIVGRIIQNVIESPRPLMVPAIAAMYPAAVQGYQFDWNSFPSDHMALYFAIALGTLWLRRACGIVLLIWSLAGVAFPACMWAITIRSTSSVAWQLPQYHRPFSGGGVDGSVSPCAKSTILRPVTRLLPRQVCFVCASRSLQCSTASANSASSAVMGYVWYSRLSGNKSPWNDQPRLT